MKADINHKKFISYSKNDVELAKLCEFFAKTLNEEIDLIVTESASLELSENLKGRSGLMIFDCLQGQKLLKVCPLQSLLSSRYNMADHFYFENGNLGLPDLCFYQSICDSTIKFGKAISARDRVYIFSEDEKLRVAAGACLNLGFSELVLVTTDLQRAEREIDFLGRLFAGKNKITKMIPQDLTLQTVDASLLINTLDLKKFPEIAADMVYFNFMKKNGVFIDTCLAPENRSVHAEAQTAGLKIILPEQIQAIQFGHVARKLSLNFDAQKFLSLSM
jgi:hypothetical protein